MGRLWLILAVMSLLPCLIWMIESREESWKRSLEIGRLIKGNKIWETMTETNERLSRVKYTKAGGR